MSSSIRIGIAEDHAITRYALSRHIRAQPNMVVAGEVESGDAAVRLVRQGGVDVLLLDLMMPGTGALDVLTRIKARVPELAVVVLTNYPPERYAVSALRLGASAYLTKQCDPDEIVKAIKVTHSGTHYLTPDIGELLAASANSHNRDLHEKLTQREFQLLVHFAKGESSSEIAAMLSLSPKTVSTYRTLLLKKLGMKTSSEVTHYAMSKGLLD